MLKIQKPSTNIYDDVILLIVSKLHISPKNNKNVTLSLVSLSQTYIYSELSFQSDLLHRQAAVLKSEVTAYCS